VKLQVRHSYMDSPCHAFSGDMWYTTWFLTVKKIWPCKVGSPEEWLMQEHRQLIKRASVERKTAGQASTNFENTLILLRKH
jgi:hypothetical protein